MTPRLSELPIFLVDLFGSAMMIVLSILALRYAYRLMRREPRELLLSYLYMFTLALMAFSVGRGVGHIVRGILVNIGYKDVWESVGPVSGAINTISFIYIAAITCYYYFVEKAFLLLKQAHEKLGVAFDEIRRSRDQAILLERCAISDRMSATLAHETRNPIFVIANFAKSLLRKSDMNDQANSKLRIIVEESHKLERLIDGILKAKHDLPYLMSQVSVGELLAGLQKIGEDKAEAAKIGIHLSPSPEELWLHVDRESVLVGLTEIVQNAIEASPKGGTVDIATVRVGEKVIFRISDSGKGIPSALLPKIFEPCFSTKEFSAGLGLAFAREILKRNRGLLEVVSIPEGGTTISVAFPLAGQTD
ncbi:integral membrane sensor signal transduction histidine kinase [Solidesulfovibrio fructosivorans JJ]]|uniref:histidine kinase n=1 Tax=Solidesulfovibrio fructosivorans JJ] TaxID=596151 RepID=E1JY17_SOLFR|nr:ATP-binding protein [Solidesulfovibrio fructosivorans]EFL50755.1 integral membrane sensor signal transduction histidine kinase [Solidesulfovibrio fructosivorans JJ]]